MVNRMSCKDNSFTIERKKKMYNLYHGTSRMNAENIMKNGFLIDFKSDQMMYGAGVYFTDDIDAAKQYGKYIIQVSLEMREITKKCENPKVNIVYPSAPFIDQVNEEIEILDNIREYNPGASEKEWNEMVKRYYATAKRVREDAMARGIKVSFNYEVNNVDVMDYVFYDVEFLNKLSRKYFVE